MHEEKARVAVVWGAGGLGIALAEALSRRGAYDQVVLVSRKPESHTSSAYTVMEGDLLDEASIERVISDVKALGQVVTVVSAVGVLHGDDLQPEKALRQVNSQNLHHVFSVNAIGPSLLAKHFVPIMPRKSRAVFAAISARVGSISDNRLGGWHAYRASKAALNMMLKTISIEWQRANPHSVCIGLHPGTVDTDLSKPFQRGVPPEKLFTPEHSATMLVGVLENATSEQTGGVFDYAGKKVPE